MEETIAAIGIFFIPFIFAGIIFWFKSQERQKLNQLQADLYSRALEKGQEIPPGLFEVPKKDKTNVSLNAGIILIALGIGIFLFLFTVVDNEDNVRAASVGIIPFFLGIGFLLIHFLSKKKKCNDEE